MYYALPDESVDDELGVLEDLEEIAGEEAGHEAPDVVPECPERKIFQLKLKIF